MDWEKVIKLKLIVKRKVLRHLLRGICLLSLINIASIASFSQNFIPLWPDGKKPNNNGKAVKDTIYNDRIWAVGTPGMYSFLVPKEENKGAAVLICPGGGYVRLSYLYNGYNLAKWFNTQGINAFVLISRLPHQKDLISRQTAPLQDAQRAMKIIRSNAMLWGINSQKTGVMGTSAGGHTAAMLGTRTDDVSLIKDSLDGYNFRPDFIILLSPVITMGKYTHKGSRDNFLGADTASVDMIQKYSNENNVTLATPPVFLVHAFNDKTVSVQNSLLFYNALIEKNVNASIHIFPQGQHGINLINNPGSTELWYDLLRKWLVEMGFNDISVKK